MNYAIDESDGFAMLEEKRQKLIPIIKQYDSESIIQSIFAITSWRNNRGAQESCLALNAVVSDNEEWGNKQVTTYDEFISLFEAFYPLLQISVYDDPVLMDFGEVKLCYKSRYYSIITGTGHTSPIFADLQFLDSVSEAVCMDSFSCEILNYSNNMLTQLLKNNVPISGDFSLSPKFECPSIDYFKSVQCFFKNKIWERLDNTLLSMLSTTNNAIIKSHFILKDEVSYPLFNPSLITDYFTNIVAMISKKDATKIIKHSLVEKIRSIYCHDDSYSAQLIENCIFLNNRIPIKENCTNFAYFQDDSLIVFFDTSDDNSEYLSVIAQIESAFANKVLSIVNLAEKVSSNSYKAYQLNENCQLHIICYDEHINVDETVFKFGSKENRRIYSAIDIMYMIMVSEDILQLTEFDEKSKTEEAQILSWGGISDYYTLFLQEKGYLSKGAIEYQNIYSEIDTSAAHIFTKYLELNNCFPFHLHSRQFCEPECWNIVIDDNGIYQYAKKSRELLGGSVLILNNRCTIYLSYDFLSILRKDRSHQTSINLESFRGIVERFIIEYQASFSTIPCLDYIYIQLCCHSLSGESACAPYVHISNVSKNHKTIRIDYEVDCNKLMKDISMADNRAIEYRMIHELFQPVLDTYSEDLAEVYKIIEERKTKKKTVETKAIRLDYYFNANIDKIKETDTSQLSVRKQIAQITAAANVISGIYEQKDATGIVRRIQESAVNNLEKKVIQFNRIELHIKLLSAYSSELFSIRMNQESFKLSKDIDERERENSCQKALQAVEDSKNNQASLLYLLETNLYFIDNRGKTNTNDIALSELMSFAQWLVSLQNSSDLCFHTDSKTKLCVLDDYRIDVELGEEYLSKYLTTNKRRLSFDAYDIKGNQKDKEYFEKVATAFYVDTGVNFRILESVLQQLSQSSFPSEKINFNEIAPNVFQININDAVNDYCSFVLEDVSYDDAKRAFEFLTINESELKTIDGKNFPILPIWEREKRNNRFSIKPLLKDGDNYIYSPIMADEIRKRWTNGFLQFYPPYEIGLSSVVNELAEWKNYYEHLFSTDIEHLFKDLEFDYYKHDVDIRREDRKGNHPSINELGDYDVIGLCQSLKTVFIIECKVLQPIGSIFEHSNEQKRFFKEEKFDEKFQKRINYFSEIYRSFFANIGYELEDCVYQIRPYMVVNKVFESYYKKVLFSIVTYDELKSEITSLKEWSNLSE
jgi:hypothetical protein